MKEPGTTRFQFFFRHMQKPKKHKHIKRANKKEDCGDTGWGTLGNKVSPAHNFPFLFFHRLQQSQNTLQFAPCHPVSPDVIM